MGAVFPYVQKEKRVYHLKKSRNDQRKRTSKTIPSKGDKNDSQRDLERCQKHFGIAAFLGRFYVDHREFTLFPSAENFNLPGRIFKESIPFLVEIGDRLLTT